MEVVVEAVVELLHDGVESGCAEDFAAARSLEFLDDELSQLRHVSHGALCVARHVDSLRAEDIEHTHCGLHLDDGARERLGRLLGSVHCSGLSALNIHVLVVAQVLDSVISLVDGSRSVRSRRNVEVDRVDGLADHECLVGIHAGPGLGEHRSALLVGGEDADWCLTTGYIFIGHREEVLVVDRTRVLALQVVILLSRRLAGFSQELEETFECWLIDGVLVDEVVSTMDFVAAHSSPVVTDGECLLSCSRSFQEHRSLRSHRIADFLGLCDVVSVDAGHLESSHAFRELVAEVGVECSESFAVLVRDVEVHVELSSRFESPDGASRVVLDVDVAFADEVHLAILLYDIVFESRTNLLSEVPVAAELGRYLVEDAASLHLLHIECSGLVSEVPYVGLAGEHLLEEGELGGVVVRFGERVVVHALPDGVELEGFLEAAALTYLVHHLGDG